MLLSLKEILTRPRCLSFSNALFFLRLLCVFAIDYAINYHRPTTRESLVCRFISRADINVACKPINYTFIKKRKRKLWARRDNWREWKVWNATRRTAFVFSCCCYGCWHLYWVLCETFFRINWRRPQKRTAEKKEQHFRFLLLLFTDRSHYFPISFVGFDFIAACNSCCFRLWIK